MDLINWRDPFIAKGRKNMATTADLAVAVNTITFFKSNLLLEKTNVGRSIPDLAVNLNVNFM